MRTARQIRGWSQETLAAELGKIGINVGGQSGAARIERGERPTRLNEVIAIADFLDIDMNMNLAVYRYKINNEETADYDKALEETVASLMEIEREIKDVNEQVETMHAEVAQAQSMLKRAEQRLAVLSQRRAELERAYEGMSAVVSLGTTVRRMPELWEKPNGE